MNPLFIKMGWSYCGDRMASQGCRVTAEGPAQAWRVPVRTCPHAL